MQTLLKLLNEQINADTMPYTWEDARNYTAEFLRTVDTLGWLESAFSYWTSRGACVTVYAGHLSIRSEHDVGAGYEGVILHSGNVTEWMNTWWKVYYVLDDGSEIYSKTGKFVDELLDAIVREPVVMITQDNDTRHSTNEPFPIDQRKLLGYWTSIETFVHARHEPISRPNPFGEYPGKNRKTSGASRPVTLKQIIRGDVDDWGVATLYHVCIRTPERKFFKVGITKSSIDRRFSSSRLQNGWEIEVLGTAQCQYVVAATFEALALDSNRAEMHIKFKEFAGWTECREQPFVIDWEAVQACSPEAAKDLAHSLFAQRRTMKPSRQQT